MPDHDKPKYYTPDALSHGHAVAQAARYPESIKPPTHYSGIKPSDAPSTPAQFDLQSGGLSGTKTLLCGAPGSGKTTALITAIKAGLKLAVVVTDPGGEESLLAAVKMYDVDPDNLYYRYVAPAAASWAVLKDMATRINMMGYKDLTELKMGIAKHGHTQFLDLIDTCADFKCQRTGRTIGPIDSLGPDWMVSVDSASGLNIMAMELMIGGKPAAHQGEWGVAMNAEEKLVMKWCADLRCFFTLTAHIEREMDETIGRPMLGPGFLGRKLAPKLPRFFSDYVKSYREGDQFFWSTVDSQMDLKARTLPLRDKLQPSFEQIVATWRQRAEQAQVQASVPVKPVPVPETTEPPETRTE